MANCSSASHRIASPPFIPSSNACKTALHESLINTYRYRYLIPHLALVRAENERSRSVASCNSNSNFFARICRSTSLPRSNSTRLDATRLTQSGDQLTVKRREEMRRNITSSASCGRFLPQPSESQQNTVAESIPTQRRLIAQYRCFSCGAACIDPHHCEHCAYIAERRLLDCDTTSDGENAARTRRESESDSRLSSSSSDDDRQRKSATRLRAAKRNRSRSRGGNRIVPKTNGHTIHHGLPSFLPPPPPVDPPPTSREEIIKSMYSSGVNSNGSVGVRPSPNQNTNTNPNPNPKGVRTMQQATTSNVTVTTPNGKAMRMLSNGTLPRRIVAGKVDRTEFEPRPLPQPIRFETQTTNANAIGDVNGNVCASLTLASEKTLPNPNVLANMLDVDMADCFQPPVNLEGTEYSSCGVYERLIGETSHYNQLRVGNYGDGMQVASVMNPLSRDRDREVANECELVTRSIGKHDGSSTSVAFYRNHLQTRSTESSERPLVESSKRSFVPTAYATKLGAKRLTEQRWKFASILISIAFTMLAMITVCLLIVQTLKLNDTRPVNHSFTATGHYQVLDSKLVAEKPTVIHLSPFQLAVVTFETPVVQDVRSESLYSITVDMKSRAQPLRHLGVFLRFNHRPSPVDYDFVEVLRFDRDDSTHEQRTLWRILRKGRWHLGLYVDDVNASAVVAVTVRASGGNSGESFKNCTGVSCGDNGFCVNGQCVCFGDYDGRRCESRRCPALCNNRGFYRDGRCECFAEYGGAECEIEKQNPCSGIDCGAHGTCVKGSCRCNLPYAGRLCDVITCAPHNCSGNGQCINGNCRCFHGWLGESCEAKADSQSQPTSVLDGAALDCAARCVHGRCIGADCVCDSFWEGERCDLPSCHPRCSPPYGNCVNATCQCTGDYYGPMCQSRYCEDCKSPAVCVRRPGEAPSCQCSSEQMTQDCKFKIEQQCTDSIDNDNDGLVDCADPNCCAKPECSSSRWCKSPSDAETAKLSNTISSQQGNFFERVSFLFDGDDAPQRGVSSPEVFDQRLLSVVTGYVRYQGVEVLNCVVSLLGLPQFGYTLTAKHGIFDIAVNGGQSLTLNISCRNGKLEHYVDLFVPSNRFVVLLPNELTIKDQRKPAATAGEAVSRGRTSPLAPRSVTSLATNGGDVRCEETVRHDPTKLRPRVHTYWLQEPVGNRNAPPTKGVSRDCGERDDTLSVSRVLVDRSALLEYIRLPNSNVNLVWSNLATTAYAWVVNVVMTPLTWPQMPVALQNVYLQIDIEGRPAYDPVSTNYSKLRRFDASPNLTFELVYPRENLYSQSSSGLLTANIHVGYEYSGCLGKVFWERTAVRFAAAIQPAVNIGGWSLDILHSFNFQSNVLQRGDLSSVYYDLSAYKLTRLVGNERQRRSITESSGDTLYNALAMLTDSFGNLIVADHNYLRYVNTSRDGANELRNIVELRPYSYLPVAPERYHLAISPRLPGYLYISDALERRVSRVKLADRSDQELEPVLGTGEQCALGEEDCSTCEEPQDCALLHPRSLTFDAAGNGYLVDGASLKTFTDGSVRTLINGGQFAATDRLRKSVGQCVGDAIPFSNLLLRSPIVQYSAFEDHLFLADRDVLYRLSLESSLAFVVGASYQCTTEIEAPHNFERIRDVAIRADGDIFILDGAKIVRLRTDQHVESLMSSSTRSHEPLGSARFSNVKAIAVSDDKLFIADRSTAGETVWMAYHSGAQLTTVGEQYAVEDAASGETYFFDSNGRHLSTAVTSASGELVTKFEFGHASYYIPTVTQYDANGSIVWNMSISKADNLRDFEIRTNAWRNGAQLADNQITLKIAEATDYASASNRDPQPLAGIDGELEIEGDSGATRHPVVVEVIVDQRRMVKFEYSSRATNEPMLTRKHYPENNYTFSYFYSLPRGLLSRVGFPTGESIELAADGARLKDDLLIYNVSVNTSSASSSFSSQQFTAVLGGATSRIYRYNQFASSRIDPLASLFCVRAQPIRLTDPNSPMAYNQKVVQLQIKGDALRLSDLDEERK